ncbi:TonB family protein [Sporomusa sp.]|uniref:energy transducer TonB n=1 Tax=Sporomusa sp. TaxID=2078658 RepID=UPI002C77D6A6|nr:TonB family protein [Sporomusa sp.]HWR08812.1 TonB family protein [Sporomusa sp.]
MTFALRWRKAISVSVCLHIFLLVIAGYLVAGLLTAAATVPEEIILNMDLVSDSGLPEPAASSEISVPAPTVSTPAEPVQAVTEVKPVVTTSELSMTEVESPAAIVSAQPHAAATTEGPETKASGPPPSAGGGGIAAPGILSRVDPLYPPAARQAGLEGTVLLKIQVLANGRPGEISVARSTGYPALDEAAAAAVRKWQFIPAKDRSSGRTVACTTTLPVSFRLQNQKN